MSATRKILVCSAGFGEGHNTAARNLCAALDELGAGRCEAQFTDIFGARHPAIYEVFRKGYVTLMNRAPQAWAALYGLLDAAPAVDAPIGALLVTLRNAFTALLEETRPAAVVSTYPFYGYLLNDIARRGGPSGFPRLMVVTDSISINSIWHRCESDFLLVPNAETAAVIRRAGVPEEKLRVLGFPVEMRFAELDKMPPRPDPAGPDGRRVLYMINAGKRAAPEVVQRLLALENIALTVTVGRDARMRKTMEEIIAGASDRAQKNTRLIGWTREVPELLAHHHLIISKAGGATTQEAIAARCPMIISQIAPGQEEGNAQLLIENGAGCLALSPERMAATVEEAFAEDAKLCRRWTDNIGKLSRPDAARDNARFILETIERP